MKSNSQQYHNFLIPVLEHVTDFSQEDRLYLAESGLDLWRDVLHNSNQMTASLLNLFQRWIFCMVRFTDYLKVCIDILRSYFLLGGRQFVERYHKELKEILGNLVKTLDCHGMNTLTHAITTCIQLFPQESPQFLQPVIEHCILKIVDITHPFTARDIKPYLLILGRSFFENFSGSLQLLLNLEKTETRNLINEFVTRWALNLGKIKVQYEQKICLISLANFAQSQQVSNSSLGKMVSVLMRGAVSCRDTDLGFDQLTSPPLTEEQRQIALVLSDKSYRFDTVPHVKKMIELIMQRLGNNTFRRYLKQVDDHVINKFSKFPS